MICIHMYTYVHIYVYMYMYIYIYIRFIYSNIIYPYAPVTTWSHGIFSCFNAHQRSQSATPPLGLQKTHGHSGAARVAVERQANQLDQPGAGDEVIIIIIIIILLVLNDGKFRE